MISQVTIVIVALSNYACAAEVGGGFSGLGKEAVRSGYSGRAGSEYGGGQNYPPKPYRFRYQASDEQGNVHYRNEESDQSGAVKGSYGYTDNQGLYREVQYIADARGFRANIKTNEPGTDGKKSPADINIVAEQPPVGIEDPWTPRGYSGGHGDGAVSIREQVASRPADIPKMIDAIKASGGSKCKGGGTDKFDIRNCINV